MRLRSRASRSGRAGGFTLLELVVALLLTALLLGVTLRAYDTLRAAGQRLIRRSAEVTALRSTRTVLTSELRDGVAGVDWAPYPPDSIRLRVFRYMGTVCGPPTDSSLVVRRGVGRRPEPGKDSVLILSGVGAWEVYALTSWSPGASCQPGWEFADSTETRVERWTVAPYPEDPAVLLLFEVGSYHLSGGALRYRRGRGGRQPLTEEVLGEVRLLDTLGALRAALPLGPGAEITVRLATSPEGR